MNPLEVAILFDARADRYAHDACHRQYAERLVSATPLRPGAIVLDAGTGTGFAARAVSRRVGASGRVLGVDVSAGMLARARTMIRDAALENVEVLEGDVTELSDVESGTFDAI